MKVCSYYDFNLIRFEIIRHSTWGNIKILISVRNCYLAFKVIFINFVCNLYSSRNWNLRPKKTFSTIFLAILVSLTFLCYKWDLYKILKQINLLDLRCIKYSGSYLWIAFQFCFFHHELIYSVIKLNWRVRFRFHDGDMSRCTFFGNNRSCCTCTLHLYFTSTFHRHCRLLLQDRLETKGCKRCFHLLEHFCRLARIISFRDRSCHMIRKYNGHRKNICIFLQKEPLSNRNFETF